MNFTCNYCGQTLDGSEYATHVVEHSDSKDNLVDNRYRPSHLEEARGQTADTYREWRNY